MYIAGVTNKDTITKLLTTLPSSYQAIKEVIFNQPERTITSVIAAPRQHAGIIQKVPVLEGKSSGGKFWRKPNALQHPFQRFDRKTKREICWYCAKPGCFLYLNVMKLRQRGDSTQFIAYHIFRDSPDPWVSVFFFRNYIKEPRRYFRLC